MEPQPDSENRRLIQTHAERLLGYVTPIAHKAAWLAGKVRTLAVLSILSAIVFWILLFVPSFVGQIWFFLLTIAVLVVFLLPGGVQMLLFVVLRQISRIPQEFVSRVQSGEKGVVQLLEMVSRPDEQMRRRRARRFFGILFEIRTLILNSKGLLIQYAGLVRLVHPFMIAVYIISFVACLLLIGTTIIATSLVLLF